MNLKQETKKIDNLLLSLNKSIMKKTKDQLVDYGLTLPRFHLLWKIGELQPINMSQLHEKLYIQNSTLTVLVDGLVEDTFVKRYRNPEDRRVVLLEITEEGKKCLQDILEIRQMFLQQGLDHLHPEEQKQLISLLTPVSKKVEGELKKDLV